MIPFLLNVQKRQIYGDRGRSVVAYGWSEVWRDRISLRGGGGGWGRDENVLKLLVAILAQF